MFEYKCFHIEYNFSSGEPTSTCDLSVPEIRETFGLCLDLFPSLGLNLGLENAHFLGLSLEYS